MARGGPLHPKPPGHGLGKRDRPAGPRQLGAAIRGGEHSPPRRGEPSLSARSPPPLYSRPPEWCDPSWPSDTHES